MEGRMDILPNQPRVLKFGVFELDLQGGELRKSGTRLKLAGQPLQVLQTLLERPNEIVTRDQLRQQLWPDNTFVDYDLALKKAVNRLRDVLGDSAENPRYIETIPRQGYRFIGLVQAAEEPGPADVVAQTRTIKGRRWRLLVALSAAAAAVLIFALNVGRFRTRILAGSRSPEIHSLAVLPLENLSKDPSQDYFSDGITDALTTELAQIGALRVISRTSATHFKGAQETLPEIGRKLGADAIVEGSVTRGENRVRITAQLIDARADRHLWAKTYERDLKDVLGLQDEVVRDIAEEIRIKLRPEERTRLTETRMVNPQAHEAYLKGRYFYERMSVTGFRKGLEYYQQAVKLDPSYAPAYVGLAASYKELGTWGALSPREAAAHASEAVAEALALDSTSGDAHAVLGHIHFLWDWDWAGAEREYKRAMELAPPSTDTRIQYAVYLSAVGRHDEAIAVMREARALDPVSPPANGLLGVVYYWAHRFDEAIDQFQKTLAMYPDFSTDHFFLGRCYEQKGIYNEAVEEYLKAMALDGTAAEELAKYRETSVKSGRKGFLKEELRSAIASSKSHYFDSTAIAELYARLEEKDQAFQWLEKAFQQRSHNVALVNTEPMFDGLHSDPRFQDLLRRLHL
jgi:TolB-like protein/DNA-binding winged helix-turn-helix (wHTH) protein/Tfp pilus assembly protein PilF